MAAVGSTCTSTTQATVEYLRRTNMSSASHQQNVAWIPGSGFFATSRVLCFLLGDVHKWKVRSTAHYLYFGQKNQQGIHESNADRLAVVDILWSPLRKTKTKISTLYKHALQFYQLKEAVQWKLGKTEENTLLWSPLFSTLCVNSGDNRLEHLKISIRLKRVLQQRIKCV